MLLSSRDVHLEGETVTCIVGGCFNWPLCPSSKHVAGCGSCVSTRLPYKKFVLFLLYISMYKINCPIKQGLRRHGRHLVVTVETKRRSDYIISDFDLDCRHVSQPRLYSLVDLLSCLPTLVSLARLVPSAQRPFWLLGPWAPEL